MSVGIFNISARGQAPDAIWAFVLVNGGWSDYSPWSSCSHFCDTGTRSRQKNCSNPEPLYNGNDCTGEFEEIEECNTQSCLISK